MENTHTCRIGQVWRRKTSAEKVCVLGVDEKNKKVFLSGVIDFVDPEWDIDYLLENYNLDHNYDVFYKILE